MLQQHHSYFIIVICFMTQSMLNLCHCLMIILKYKIILKPSLWLVTTEGDNRWGITAKREGECGVVVAVADYGEQ